MTIALTGSTGQLGRLAIAALKAKGAGARLVALARNPQAAADLGIPVRAFDYAAPDAAALAGVEVLVLISSNDFNDRAGQHRRVIEAAKVAGVKRLIYTSILKGDQSPLLLAQDHIATEQALLASGLTYTLLRNGWYTENYTGALGGAIAHGAMIGSAGEGQISGAARADYAEAIAAVALGAGHENRIYELAGDLAFTMAGMAAEVSRQIGKPVPYTSLPAEVYTGILVGFGLPEGFAQVLADADVKAAAGGLFDDSHSLSALIGRPTTPMAAVVAAAVAAL